MCCVGVCVCAVWVGVCVGVCVCVCVLCLALFCVKRDVKADNEDWGVKSVVAVNSARYTAA